MAGECGSCTLCCKLVGVRGEVRGVPIKKPRNGWCEHCAVGQGCTVYDDRPKACDEFLCMWRACQGTTSPMQPELRPDRCGVVLAATGDPRVFAAHMDPHKSDAWKRGATWRYLQMIIHLGNSIVLDYGDLAQVKVVLCQDARGKIAAKKQKFSLPDDYGVQWSTE